MEKFKSAFQIIVPCVFIAGLFNQGLTYEALQATTDTWYQVCLFHRLTGWFCPGCGMTRAMISFFSYNVPLSFSYHPLGPVLGFGILSAWVMSFWPGTWEKAALRMKPVLQRHAVSLIVIVSIWCIYRNF